MNFATIAQQLGSPIGDVKLAVTMSEPTAAQEATIREQASTQNVNIVSVVNFSITAEAGGQTHEITNFGTTYVPRTIALPDTASDKPYMAAIIDSVTGELQFIPATVDAKGNIVIMAPHASLYAIVEKPEASFSDIQNHWAKAEIEALASKLLVKGTSVDTFSPAEQINRGEFTALISRALGLEMVSSDTSFTDVAANSWYAKAVHAAVQAKIVQGRTATTFDPSGAITREEMSVMIAKALAFAGRQPDVTAKQEGLLSAFEDNAEISAWAEAAVAQSAEAQVLRGDAQGNFKPQANATRAEAAATLKRLLEYLKFI